MTAVFVRLLVELVGLFILSRALTGKIFLFFYLLTRSRTIAVSVLMFILFPGTLIHELSHLFTAEMLWVKTGKLKLVPEGLEDQSIQAGSVEISHTDPFRRSIIGLAPFFVGILVVVILSSLLPIFWEQTLQAYTAQKVFSTPASYFVLLTSYLIFCISNTMFASPTDMKGVIPLSVALGLVAGAIYLTGFRLNIPSPLVAQAAYVLTSVLQAITAVLLLNCALFVLISGAIWLLKGKARKG